MKKLDYIDALRGLAILGVVLVHTNQFGHLNLPWGIEKVVVKGARGVQLFFVASAFTLFLSYRHRIHAERFPIRNFFIRRYVRIAPMYYLGVVYYLFQDGLGPRYWLGDEPRITVANIVSNFLFVNGFNPYWFSSIVHGGWSIAVEMLFYVVLPLLFGLIKSTRQALLFFGAALLLRFALQVILEANPLIGHAKLWEEYLTLYFPAQLPVFALGILLYFVIEEQAMPTISGPLLIAISGLLMAILVNEDWFPLPPAVAAILPNPILFGITFFLLALGLSRYPWRLLVNSTTTYLGKISFSLYLTHFAVLHWLETFGLTDYFYNATLDYGIRLLLVLILTSLLATLFYRFIEVPGQRLGSRLIKRLERNPEPSVVI